MSLHERKQVRDIVDELKDADIIEDSDSPFASPCLLVRKKTGDYRLCVDYRALNRMTVKDHYPLPRIDDQLDLLHNKKYFTSLDLRSGYYQIPVEKTSRGKTTFVTPDGAYSFKRMSFGLCNAPSFFQRVMNRILKNLRYTIAMAYLDDIIIPSETVEEGMRNLREVLIILREANLTLRIDKCKFFMTKIDYLGFEISEFGVSSGRNKLNAVGNFPVPNDVKSVRSFLGLASYVRRFVRNFAVIVKPLTDLLKKGSSFMWGDLQQKAFDLIKERLSSEPILCIYDPNAKTEVHTDASKVGLGGVLYQEQRDKKLHPISYFSRKTTAEESKYHSYELEALAIVCSVEIFRVYLTGIEFIIRTDCNSLKLLEHKRDLNPRIGRWFIRLSEFQYKIEYHTGAINTVADSLSRYPVEEGDETEIIGLPVCHINISTDWVAALQRTDPEILAICSKLEDGDTATHSKYTLCSGRLYKVSKNKFRLYVPSELQHDIVSEAHRNLNHLGVDKTLKCVKECYYFPKLRKFVTSYIN